MNYYLSLALLLSFIFFQERASWQGIVPLHSTRADVEQLLGKSGSELKSLYKTKDATVLIDYAPRPCKGILPGWSVPADTVLRLTVLPETPPRFSELSLNLEEFITRRDDTFTTYYISENSGVEYAVSSEGFISSTSYVPSNKDSHLRCAGFPRNVGNTVSHYPFDDYIATDFDDEKYHLDKLAIKLQQEQNVKAYLILYVAKSMCIDEAKSRLVRAKNYLVKEREIDAARIETILGGRRDKLTVEVYVVSTDAPPPTAAPTEKTGIPHCDTRNNNRRGAKRKPLR